MITYTIAIDKNDNGSFADTGDVITPDVLDVRWRLGMAQPYDCMAAPTFAEITVQNPSGAYSPELSALLPGKRLRIQSHDGVTTRTHFTGYIRRIEPLPGSQGSRTAVLFAQGVEHWLAQNIVRPEAQMDVGADQVIEAILSLCKVRYPTLDGYLILGDISTGSIGSKLFGQAVSRSLEAGITQFAYTGDMWGAGIPADVAIRQYVETERGHFFINRAGSAIFYNRHHKVHDGAVKAEFADSMDGLEYSYGADVVNQVEIRVTPRSVGEPETLLWTLAEPQKISSGIVRRIAASYRDSSGNPVGALLVSRVELAVNTLPDGSGANLTSHVRVAVIKSGAGAAALEVHNTYSGAVYVTLFKIYGTPLIQGDAAIVIEQNARSQTFYGMNRLTLDLRALTRVEEAFGLARYELARRHEPRGIVRALHTSTATHPAETLALTLFDRISLSETQTGHSGDYFIIGEEHHIDRGGQRHQVAWLLEPADDMFFVVGQDALNSPRYLMY